MQNIEGQPGKITITELLPILQTQTEPNLGGFGRGGDITAVGGSLGGDDGGLTPTALEADDNAKDAARKFIEVWTTKAPVGQLDKDYKELWRDNPREKLDNFPESTKWAKSLILDLHLGKLINEWYGTYSKRLGDALRKTQLSAPCRSALARLHDYCSIIGERVPVDFISLRYFDMNENLTFLGPFAKDANTAKIEGNLVIAHFRLLQSPNYKIPKGWDRYEEYYENSQWLNVYEGKYNLTPKFTL